MLIALFLLAVLAEEEEGAFRMFYGMNRDRIYYPRKQEVIREKYMLCQDRKRQLKPFAEAGKPVAKEQSDPTTKRMSFHYDSNEEFSFVPNSPPERIERVPPA